MCVSKNVIVLCSLESSVNVLDSSRIDGRSSLRNTKHECVKQKRRVRVILFCVFFPHSNWQKILKTECASPQRRSRSQNQRHHSSTRLDHSLAETWRWVRTRLELNDFSILNSNQTSNISTTHYHISSSTDCCEWHFFKRFWSSYWGWTCVDGCSCDCKLYVHRTRENHNHSKVFCKVHISNL